MKWAFSDESRRGSTYVLAAVVVETHDVAPARAELQRFLRGNQRRIHMAKESPARRRQFLTIVEQVASEAFVVEATVGRTPMGDARGQGLRRLTYALVDAGVRTWHLEWMIDQVERLDRQAIAAALAERGASAELTYDHRPPHADPLLWAADALAWAASRQRVPWATTTNLP